MADGGNANDFDMAPETTLAVVNAAVAHDSDAIPPGPFAADLGFAQGKLSGAAVVCRGEIWLVHALGTLLRAGAPQ